MFWVWLACFSVRNEYTRTDIFAHFLRGECAQKDIEKAMLRKNRRGEQARGVLKGRSGFAFGFLSRGRPRFPQDACVFFSYIILLVYLYHWREEPSFSSCVFWCVWEKGRGDVDRDGTLLFLCRLSVWGPASPILQCYMT